MMAANRAGMVFMMDDLLLRVVDQTAVLTFIWEAFIFDKRANDGVTHSKKRAVSGLAQRAGQAGYRVDTN